MISNGSSNRAVIFVFLLATSVCNAALAQETEVPVTSPDVPPRGQYTIAHASSAISVDGILDEAAWTDALTIDIPYEWWPGDNIPAIADTTCLLTYDESYLYIAFRALDPRPEDIRAHLWDRDQIYDLITDDHVLIMIDTFGDDRSAYQFRANPLGVQADAINSGVGGGLEDWSWNAIWDSAGRINEEGYAIEMVIPFNQLRFPSGGGELTWGVSAGRSYPRADRHRFNSHYTDRDNSCRLCQSDFVTGFESIAPGRNLELVPTFTALRTDELQDFPDGGLEDGDPDPQLGLTARWGVTQSLSFLAAINPDFSQVEADVAQLEINTRFALFYPETRPFFLEGTDYFASPMQAVFTRTVVDPSLGTKLTGKIGRHALGIMATIDETNTLTLPANQESQAAEIPEKVNGGVFRYRADVGADSAVGALFTDREGNGYHNRVFGADGYIRLGDTDTLNVQYLRSDTAYPDEFAEEYGQPFGSFGGNAIMADYTHLGREWVINGTYNDRDPGFRADYGFIPRVDLRSGKFQVGRIFWGGSDQWYSRFDVSGNVIYVVDHSGNETDRRFGVETVYHGPRQILLAAGASDSRQLFGGEYFDLLEAGTYFEIKPMGGFNFGFTTALGETIDLANVRKANQWVFVPEVYFNVGRRLSVRYSHTYQRLDTLGGEEIYTANLAQSRIQYMFTSRAFVRAILQYRWLHQNPLAYEWEVTESSENLFTQFLFSYKLNARTVVFAGYSDNSFGLQTTGLVRTDRTFFIKLGYSWIL
jgi:hypothetical protein